MMAYCFSRTRIGPSTGLPAGITGDEPHAHIIPQPYWLDLPQRSILKQETDDGDYLPRISWKDELLISPTPKTK